MLRVTHLVPFVAIATTFAIGCGDDHRGTPEDAAAPDASEAPADAAEVDAAQDRTPPQIVSTTPIDGDNDVPVAIAIVVQFDEPIDHVTASSFFVMRGVDPVAGEITVAGPEARFVPAAPLDVDTAYSFTITSAVTDAAGNHLASDHTYQFRVHHRRRVFITSTFGGGNLSTWSNAGGLTGLAAGDAICRARATAAGLGGTFVAWLSSSTDDAFCRVQGLTGKRAADCGQAAPPTTAGPWVRVDGQPWGGTIVDLLDVVGPRVYTPVVLDENGAIASEIFFSNTDGEGRGMVDGCGDWADSFGGVGYGGSRVTGGYWTQWGVWGCAYAAHLLCFEAGAGATLAFPAVAGKRAFITSTAVTGNLGASPDAAGQTGLAAGDAICQTRATAAGLANPAQFKAWLATSATSAASRFASDGPWVRLDGISIASSKADLLDGRLATTINLTETGEYLTGALAWTNAYYTGISLGGSCNDWFGGATYSGYVGRANDARKWSYAAYITGCDTAQEHLYCLED